MAADKKIPELPALASVAADDLFEVVDVSDATDDPTGTSARVTLAGVLSGVARLDQHNTFATDQSVGGGLDVSGTVSAGAVTAVMVTASGTVTATADITTTSGLFAGDGGGLVNLPASELNGTVPAGALPPDVALTDAANVFAARQQVRVVGAPSGDVLLSVWCGAPVPTTRFAVDDLGNVSAGGTISGNGAGLTGVASLSAANVFANVNQFNEAVTVVCPASATVPLAVKGFTAQTGDLQQWRDVGNTVLARVTAAGVFTGNGSGLTSLDATQLTSGTVADARLSSNVPLKNATNAFTGKNTFLNSTTSGSAEPWLDVESQATATGLVARFKRTGETSLSLLMLGGVTYLVGSGQIQVCYNGATANAMIGFDSTGDVVALRSDAAYSAALPESQGVAVHGRHTYPGSIPGGRPFYITGWSTTIVGRPLYSVYTTWVDQTEASRKSRFVLNAHDASAAREVLRGEASGTAPMLGFLGASASPVQTGGAATAGGTYTATEQAMLQKVYNALRTFGLLT